MDCLLCYTVVEEEFGNYNTKSNPQFCKRAIVKLFQISDDPDVQRLSEDLVICITCRRKLENVVDLVTHLEELQRKVDEAKIEIKQGLIVSKRVSEFMSKDFGMSKSTMDRLVLLKAIESMGNGRPPASEHVGNTTINESFEDQNSLDQSDEPEILYSSIGGRQELPIIEATMKSESNIYLKRYQIPPVSSTIKLPEKSNPVPGNSKVWPLRYPPAPKTTTVVEESSNEGYGSEFEFEDHKSSEDESGTSIITSNEVKRPRRASGSIVNEFTPLMDGSYQCKNCSSIISNKNGLGMHLLIHGPTEDLGKRFKCSVQGEKRFAREYDRDRHVKVVHERMGFQCPWPGCGKSFASKYYLNTHVKTVHEGRRDYKCPWNGCGKVFSNQSNLNTHAKVLHLGRKDFKCGFGGCGKVFGSKKKLQNHIAIKHKKILVAREVARSINREVIISDLNVEIFNCRIKPFCSSVFTSENERNAHEDSHLN